MVIRIKLIWRFLLLFISFVGIITIVQSLVQGEVSAFHDWFGILLLPLVVYMFVFMAPTMRMTLSNHGISVYWKIGVGPFKIWEQTNYHLRWQDVSKVYSQFPAWLPFHAIGVIGQQGQKPRMFYLGLIMTKKKESLMYLADHLGSEVIEKNVQKLIEKYRKQLAKKAHAN